MGFGSGCFFFDTIICFNYVSQIIPVPFQFETQLIEGECVELQ